MVEKVKDSLEMTDYERTLLGKAATRAEIPLLTAEDGHLLAPSDWRDIFAAFRAWARDGEFEIGGRDQTMLTATTQIEYRTKTLNRELRFIRERARKAHEDRVKAALEAKVKGIKAFGIRPVDSDAGPKSANG